MVANVLSFRAGIPITADGQLPSPEFLRFLQASIVRQGGVVAPTITDLDSQQYADAGIEETKAGLFALADALGVSPLPADITPIDVLTAEVYALREVVATLITEIDSLKGKP